MVCSEDLQLEIHQYKVRSNFIVQAYWVGVQ